MGGPLQVATDKVGKRANRSGIAFALDEYESTGHWRGCYACLHHFVGYAAKEESIGPVEVPDRVTMQLFVR
jgi:hypothetical protein